MIYEIRTYDLKPRSVPEFEKRTAAMIEGRAKYSQIGGFWSTEAGPLNQTVHIWPYEDMAHRMRVRGETVEKGDWPPKTREFVVNMKNKLLIPSHFSPVH